MAELDTKARDKLRSSQFAYVDGLPYRERKKDRFCQ